MRPKLFLIVALLSLNFNLLHSQNDLEIILNKVNNYLATFDNGYYGYLEIKDGYLIDHFKSNDYTKTKIDEFSGANLIDDDKIVALMCRNNKECVFSTYNNSYNKYAQFRTPGEWDRKELQMLLNNLLKIYNRAGTIVSESFNADKFERQFIQLLEAHMDDFFPIIVSKEGTVYQVNLCLNTFTDCIVKNYVPGISSSGQNEYVFIATTPEMSRAAANQLCKDIEAILMKDNFKPRFIKEIEYDIATRLLVNYYTEDNRIVINLDTFGSEESCSVEIRIR